MSSLYALKFGDVASKSAHRGYGHLLQAVGVLAAFGPWTLAADMIIEASLREYTAALSLLGFHTVVAVCLFLWASKKDRSMAMDFWITTVMVVVTVLTIVGVSAARVDHFDVSTLLDARALLRLATVHFAAVNVASLRPEKAW
jgi:hypothetical protein